MFAKTRAKATGVLEDYFSCTYMHTCSHTYTHDIPIQRSWQAEANPLPLVFAKTRVVQQYLLRPHYVVPIMPTTLEESDSDGSSSTVTEGESSDSEAEAVTQLREKRKLAKKEQRGKMDLARKIQERGVSAAIPKICFKLNMYDE